MSSSKDYIEFQEASSRIRRAIENLASVVSKTFIDDDQELDSALEVQTILEEALIKFLIEKDLSQSPLLDFYESLTIRDNSPSLGDIKTGRGDAFELVLETLDSEPNETISSALSQDWQYADMSEYSLIKSTMTGWYKTKEAILTYLSSKPK